jgi:hypothetical protein
MGRGHASCDGGICSRNYLHRVAVDMGDSVCPSLYIDGRRVGCSWVKSCNTKLASSVPAGGDAAYSAGRVATNAGM